jgi:polyphosphate kinase 2 (PPK2 family)
MTRRRAVPAVGEIIVLDRNWYNRAGAEYVMDLATEQHPLQEVPQGRSNCRNARTSINMTTKRRSKGRHFVVEGY